MEYKITNQKFSMALNSEMYFFPLFFKIWFVPNWIEIDDPV